MSIYNDFPINHPIWNVSDPIKVRDNYHKYYKEHIKRIKQLTGVDSQVYLSSRKNKKYMPNCLIYVWFSIVHACVDLLVGMCLMGRIHTPPHSNS